MGTRRDAWSWLGILTVISLVGGAAIWTREDTREAARLRRVASAASAVSSTLRLAAHDAEQAEVLAGGRVVRLTGSAGTRTFAVLDGDDSPLTPRDQFFAELVSHDNPTIVSRYATGIAPLPGDSAYFEAGPGGYVGVTMRFESDPHGAEPGTTYDLVTAVVARKP